MNYTHESIAPSEAQIDHYIVMRDGTVSLLETELALFLLQRVAAITDPIVLPFPRVFRTAWECEAYLKRN